MEPCVDEEVRRKKSRRADDCPSSPEFTHGEDKCRRNRDLPADADVNSRRSKKTTRRNVRTSKESTAHSASDELNTPVKMTESDRLTLDGFTSNNNCDDVRSSPSNRDKMKARKSSPVEKVKDPIRDDSIVVSKDYEEELERQMESLASKNHLSATNVKNIIRAVLTSDDFTKMMKFQLEGKREKPDFELKLTRAKTRQLLAHESVVTWLPTESGKSTQKSGVEILVSDELLEDSSDEEYNPVEDTGHSDDEAKTDDPPAENVTEVSSATTPRFEDDDKDNKENIGQRTRSKLSLSETPLEAIAQAFIPPDITTDMYANECDNQDWLNFLKQFDSNVCENNDDENDPEYNVMDEDHEDVDVEELRADNAVKVSKKELNDLMAELFEYTEMLSSDDEETSEKKPCPANENTGISESSEVNSIETTITVMPEIHSNNLPEVENWLLTEQLMKHVQLLVQSYLMGYGNPFVKQELMNQVYQMLEFLNSIQNELRKCGILVVNLEGAWMLTSQWKAYCTRTEESKELTSWYLEKKEEASRKNKKTRFFARPPLHPVCMSLSIASTAFPFPKMLPIGVFVESSLTSREMFNGELSLLAIGLEILSSNGKLDALDTVQLAEAVAKIRDMLLPVYSEKRLINQIVRLRRHKKRNPIKHFYDFKQAPPVTHILEWKGTSKAKKLSHLPTNDMPAVWSNMLQMNKHRTEFKNMSG